MKRHPQLLEQANALLMVVDIQEKFVPHIYKMDRVIKQSGLLIEAANALDIPTIVTEQYPAGLGPTCHAIQSKLAMATQTFGKTSFSCCQDETIANAITATGRKQVILCGIETHVCISQTAYDLIANDYQVTIAVDTVSSRDKKETKHALARLQNAGITLATCEAIAMELCVSSKHSAFKTISSLIK